MKQINQSLVPSIRSLENTGKMLKVSEQDAQSICEYYMDIAEELQICKSEAHSPKKKKETAFFSKQKKQTKGEEVFSFVRIAMIKKRGVDNEGSTQLLSGVTENEARRKLSQAGDAITVHESSDERQQKPSDEEARQAIAKSENAENNAENLSQAGDVMPVPETLKEESINIESEKPKEEIDAVAQQLPATNVLQGQKKPSDEEARQAIAKSENAENNAENLSQAGDVIAVPEPPKEESTNIEPEKSQREIERERKKYAKEVERERKKHEKEIKQALEKYEKEIKQVREEYEKKYNALNRQRDAIQKQKRMQARQENCPEPAGFLHDAEQLQSDFKKIFSGIEENTHWGKKQKEWNSQFEQLRNRIDLLAVYATNHYRYSELEERFLAVDRKAPDGAEEELVYRSECRSKLKKYRNVSASEASVPGDNGAISQGQPQNSPEIPVIAPEKSSVEPHDIQPQADLKTEVVSVAAATEQVEDSHQPFSDLTVAIEQRSEEKKTAETLEKRIKNRVAGGAKKVADKGRAFKRFFDQEVGGKKETGMPVIPEAQEGVTEGTVLEEMVQSAKENSADDAGKFQVLTQAELQMHMDQFEKQREAINEQTVEIQGYQVSDFRNFLDNCASKIEIDKSDYDTLKKIDNKLVFWQRTVEEYKHWLTSLPEQVKKEHVEKINTLSEQLEMQKGIIEACKTFIINLQWQHREASVLALQKDMQEFKAAVDRLNERGAKGNNDEQETFRVYKELMTMVRSTRIEEDFEKLPESKSQQIASWIQDKRQEHNALVEAAQYRLVTFLTLQVKELQEKLVKWNGNEDPYKKLFAKPSLVHAKDYTTSFNHLLGDIKNVDLRKELVLELKKLRETQQEIFEKTKIDPAERKQLLNAFFVVQDQQLSDCTKWKSGIIDKIETVCTSQGAHKWGLEFTEDYMNREYNNCLNVQKTLGESKQNIGRLEISKQEDDGKRQNYSVQIDILLEKCDFIEESFGILQQIIKRGAPEKLNRLWEKFNQQGYAGEPAELVLISREKILQSLSEIDRMRQKLSDIQIQEGLSDIHRSPPNIVSAQWQKQRSQLITLMMEKLTKYRECLNCNLSELPAPISITPIATPIATPSATPSATPVAAPTLMPAPGDWTEYPIRQHSAVSDFRANAQALFTKATKRIFPNTSAVAVEDDTQAGGGQNNGSPVRPPQTIWYIGDTTPESSVPVTLEDGTTAKRLSPADSPGDQGNKESNNQDEQNSFVPNVYSTVSPESEPENDSLSELMPEFVSVPQSVPAPSESNSANSSASHHNPAADRKTPVVKKTRSNNAILNVVENTTNAMSNLFAHFKRSPKKEPGKQPSDLMHGNQPRTSSAIPDTGAGATSISGASGDAEPSTTPELLIQGLPALSANSSIDERSVPGPGMSISVIPDSSDDTGFSPIPAIQPLDLLGPLTPSENQEVSAPGLQPENEDSVRAESGYSGEFESDPVWLNMFNSQDSDDSSVQEPPVPSSMVEPSAQALPTPSAVPTHGNQPGTSSAIPNTGEGTSAIPGSSDEDISPSIPATQPVNPSDAAISEDLALPDPDRQSGSIDTDTEDSSLNESIHDDESEPEPASEPASVSQPARSHMSDHDLVVDHTASTAGKVPSSQASSSNAASSVLKAFTGNAASLISRLPAFFRRPVQKGLSEQPSDLENSGQPGTSPVIPNNDADTLAVQSGSSDDTWPFITPAIQSSGLPDADTPENLRLTLPGRHLAGIPTDTEDSSSDEDSDEFESVSARLNIPTLADLANRPAQELPVLPTIPSVPYPVQLHAVAGRNGYAQAPEPESLIPVPDVTPAYAGNKTTPNNENASVKPNITPLRSDNALAQRVRYTPGKESVSMEFDKKSDKVSGQGRPESAGTSKRRVAGNYLVSPFLKAKEAIQGMRKVRANDRGHNAPQRNPDIPAVRYSSLLDENDETVEQHAAGPLFVSPAPAPAPAPVRPVPVGFGADMPKQASTSDPGTVNAPKTDKSARTKPVVTARQTPVSFVRPPSGNKKPLISPVSLARSGVGTPVQPPVSHSTSSIPEDIADPLTQSGANTPVQPSVNHRTSITSEDTAGSSDMEDTSEPVVHAGRVQPENVQETPVVAETEEISEKARDHNERNEFWRGFVAHAGDSDIHPAVINTIVTESADGTEFGYEARQLLAGNVAAVKYMAKVVERGSGRWAVLSYYVRKFCAFIGLVSLANQGPTLLKSFCESQKGSGGAHLREIRSKVHNNKATPMPIRKELFAMLTSYIKESPKH